MVTAIDTLSYSLLLIKVLKGEKLYRSVLKLHVTDLVLAAVGHGKEHKIRVDTKSTPSYFLDLNFSVL